MRPLKLTLAYDGTDYSGWQVQGEKPTLQRTVEGAIRCVTGEFLRVVASGRTDAGVHALGQVASFSTQCALPLPQFCRAINANLPCDVRVLAIEETHSGFHAIRDAVSKRYRYVIQDGPIPDVFVRRHCWFIPQRLDEAAMQRAAQSLVGTHDFTSFQAAGSPRSTAIRTIMELTVRRGLDSASNRITIEVEANGFLYNMVRIIVGTLVDVGRSVQPWTWPAEVLALHDRRLAGRTAPPAGLFLAQVKYAS
jgi:tRNA pseudouridine38-40 synthase